MSIAEFTTKNNVTYKLEMIPNTLLYKWTSSGAVPNKIKTAYLDKAAAFHDMQIYNDYYLEDKKELLEPTPLERLDMLTKRKEMVSFAEGHGIEVPDGLTRPTQIKKMLKATLESK